MTAKAPPAPIATWKLLAVAFLAIAILSLMDALMKAASIGLGAASAAFWRSVFCLPIAGFLFVLTGGKMPPRASWKIHIARAAVSALMVVTFFHGLTKVPLAEAVALTFIAPLIAIYLGSLFLHEKIERLALLGSIIGFAGVLIMIAGRIGRGNYGADIWLGIASLIMAALLYAINLVLMRKQALIAKPVDIVFFQSLLVLVFLSLPAPFYAKMPNSDQFLLIVASAGCTVVSLLLLSWSYARAKIQHLAPIEYTAFLWATFFGYMMFQEAVTIVVLLGTIAIVAGCLMASWKQPT